MTQINATTFVGVASRNEYFTFFDASYVDAGAGNDGVVGSFFSDYIMGGTGDDIIQANTGNDVVIGDFASDVNSSVGGNDFIDAGIGNDSVFGGGGDDFIFGSVPDEFNTTDPDDDYLAGGAGNDVIWGGRGSDTIIGGDGDDVLFGSTRTVGGSVTLTVALTHNGTTDAAESRNFIGFVPLTGDDGAADSLDGGNGNDFLAGGSGDDTLRGGNDQDQLDGSAGADLIDGGQGFDFARYDGSLQGVVVRLDSGGGLNGDAQGDSLTGIEGLIGSAQQDFLIGDTQNNALIGQGGDDWLFGQGGNDELRGGTGSDQLIGGSGADFLYGETGNDQFWTLAGDFQSGVWDIIYDFGESAGNFDYLRFEGIGAAQLIIGDNGGNAVITTGALNYSGGIIILNFSGAQTLDQLIFA